MSLLPLVLIGCSTQQSVHPIGREVIRRGAEPECFQISEEDAEMAKAVKEAEALVTAAADRACR